MQPVPITVFGKYGVARTVVFATQDVTDVDDVYQGIAWAAGDARISKDGAAEAASTNTPARITTTHHSIAFTAAEMQCTELVCVIRDQTEPEVFEPILITVINRMNLGQLSIDATQIGGNANAVEATGVGTGHGFSGTAGASGKICNFFDTLEGSEPATAIAANATFAAILQHAKRRLFNRNTSTSALLTIYKDDNTTPLCTMVVGDDGTTASKARAA